MRAAAARSRPHLWGGPLAVGVVAAAGTVLERALPGPWQDSIRVSSAVPELPLEIPLLLLWGLAVDWVGLRLPSYRGCDRFDRTARALMGAAVAVLVVIAWDILFGRTVPVSHLLPLGFLVLGLLAPSVLGRGPSGPQGGRAWTANGSTLRDGLRY